MANIAELGFDVDSAPLAQATGNLAKMEKASMEAADAADDVGDAAARAGKKIETGSKQAAKSAHELGGSLRSVKGIATELAAGLAAGFGVAGIAATFSTSISRAREFRKALAEVASQVQDTGPLEQHAQVLKDMAVQYGSAPTAQVKAYYEAISAGIDEGAAAFEALHAANKLAVGGLTTIEVAIDGLTSVLNAYQVQGLAAADASDAMFVAMKAGKLTIDELASNIGTVAPTAAAVGVSFDELTASIAAITTVGVNTPQAVTQINAALTALIKPSSEASKLAAKLGIDFSVAGLKAKGFAGFMAEVAEKTGGSQEQLGQLFGSVEAIRGVLALTGPVADTFNGILGDMENKAGATAKSYGVLAETADAAFNRLGAAVQVKLIDLGDKLLNVLAPAAVLIADNIDVIASTIGTATQITVAYLAIFYALPMAYTAATAAIARFTAAQLSANLAMTMGIGASQGLIAQFGLMHLAGSTLFAAFAGWQIGSWLRENFVEARIAGVAFVGAMEKFFAQLELAWDVYKATSIAVLEGIINYFRGYVISLTTMAADAAESLDLFGVHDERIASMRKFVASITPVESATTKLAKAVGEATDKYKAKIATIERITSEMVDDEMATVDLTAATNTQTKATENATAANITHAASLGLNTEEKKELTKILAELKEQEKQYTDELVKNEKEMLDNANAADKLRMAYEQQVTELEQEVKILQLSGTAREAYVRQLQAEDMARRTNNGNIAETTEKYRGLLEQIDMLSKMEDAAREYERIWLNAADSVGDALTTALFDGAESGADAIKGVMEQLARDLVRFWLQQKIIIPLQQRVMGPGGIGGAQLGQGIGGIAMGGLLGFGTTGSIGGALGGAAGSWLGNIGATMATQAVAAGALGSTIGGILGSVAPIIGTLLGSFLGNALGNLFGSDPKPRIRINSSGAGIGNIGTRGTTALGTLAFNADDLEDTRGAERQFLEAIQALDQGFVTLVGTFGLGQEQLNLLRDAASSWSVDLRNSAITAENVLGSRFTTLLGTFDEHIVSFVGSAGTLEERMGRLAEALFIDAAAASGELVDDFDTLVGLLEDFGKEGEALDSTYARLVGSTMLLEDALRLMGRQLDLGRVEFVEFAAEIAEAAGGLEQATALWSSYFETFYSEQERAQLRVSQASTQAADAFGEIGLSVDDFMGSDGLRRFRDLYEERLPNMTAEQVVQWLQAANALGVLHGALAELQAIIDAVAEATATAAQRAADAFAQVGPGFGEGPGDAFNTPVGVNPYTPAPGGPVAVDANRPFYTPYPGGPVAIDPGHPMYPGGSGSQIDNAINERYERELEWIRRLSDMQNSLLLDSRLSTLTVPQQLDEAMRQYQDVYARALAGDEGARGQFESSYRTVLELARQQHASGEAYESIFDQILGNITTLQQSAQATVDMGAEAQAQTQLQVQMVSLLERRVQGSEEETAAMIDEIRQLRADLVANRGQVAEPAILGFGNRRSGNGA